MFALISYFVENTTLMLFFMVACLYAGWVITAALNTTRRSDGEHKNIRSGIII